MRDERITYWKCSTCYGTGKVIRGRIGSPRAEPCEKCDGTGNALVDGATERHKRRIAEIEQRSNR